MRNKRFAYPILIIGIISSLSCHRSLINPFENSKVQLIVLGNVQDAGSPHAGCKKSCCKFLFEHPDLNRMVVCLGIVDQESKQSYLFEATPDISKQMKRLTNFATFQKSETPDGIFLTHAHIGHYSGLMYLGREALNAPSIPVYSMPKMKTFLENNGPWNQLVKLNNIQLTPIQHQTMVNVTPNIEVKAFIVPHRDEYSETVGYLVKGPSKKAIFIPDIDKWEKWDIDIIELIKTVDYAFLDATFYDAAEMAFRNIKEIPHPFISESMDKFKDLPSSEKQKIYFIHINHTNPALDPKSSATKTILKNGFNVARMDQVFGM